MTPTKSLLLTTILAGATASAAVETDLPELELGQPVTVKVPERPRLTEKVKEGRAVRPEDSAKLLRFTVNPATRVRVEVRPVSDEDDDALALELRHSATAPNEVSAETGKLRFGRGHELKSHLLAGGEYVLFLRGDEGEYRVSVEKVPEPAVQVRTLQRGQTVRGMLDGADALNEHGAFGERYEEYRFDGAAGSTVRFFIAGRRTHLALRLSNGEKGLLRGEGGGWWVAKLPVSGPHTLEVHTGWDASEYVVAFDTRLLPYELEENPGGTLLYPGSTLKRLFELPPRVSTSGAEPTQPPAPASDAPTAPPSPTEAPAAKDGEATPEGASSAPAPVAEEKPKVEPKVDRFDRSRTAIHVYTFEGRARQRATITLKTAGATPHLILLWWPPPASKTPFGEKTRETPELVAADHDGVATGSAAKVDVTLPANGTYLVAAIADLEEGQREAPYSIELLTATGKPEGRAPRLDEPETASAPAEESAEKTSAASTPGVEGDFRGWLLMSGARSVVSYGVGVGTSVMYRLHPRFAVGGGVSASVGFLQAPAPYLTGVLGPAVRVGGNDELNLRITLGLAQRSEVFLNGMPYVALGLGGRVDFTPFGGGYGWLNLHAEGHRYESYGSFQLGMGFRL